MNKRWFQVVTPFGGQKAMTENEPGFINQVVLCELVWVLEDCYDQKPGAIQEVLHQLLRVAELRLENPDVVKLALSDYAAGGGDFSDHLISRSNLEHGCQHTLTFDKKAAKATGFRSAY